MCLAALYQQVESAQPLSLQPVLENQHLIRAYHEKVVQCLILGKYTKCVPYTLETLLHYLHIEYLQSEDTQIGIWAVLGLIVRLALRMGYHRDGSHSPRISPFQAEMRRRVWAVIFELDAITSAQFGLPRMILQSQCDTADPLNLLDEDFDENIVHLPPPRPETEHTTTQFLVTKNRLLSVFAAILDLASSPRPPSYREVMRLDRVLHDTYQTIPSGLRERPIAKSITDGPDMIARRILLALTFQRSRCILHRKYLIHARTESGYAYSRTSCIEAAREILHYQSILHQETQVGGRMSQEWKLSSLVKQEFLLATTILCLDLDQDIAAALLSRTEKCATAETDGVIESLTISYPIWLEWSDFSREARKAAEVVRIVLGKAQKMKMEHSSAEILGLSVNTAGSSSDSDTRPMGIPLRCFLYFRGYVVTDNSPDLSLLTRGWTSKYPSMTIPTGISPLRTNSLDPLLPIGERSPMVTDPFSVVGIPVPKP
jgi:hypothetical protein